MIAPSADRVLAIVWKEWLDLRRNRAVLGVLTALPLLLTVMASGTMIATVRAQATHATTTTTTADATAAMAKMPAHIQAMTSDPKLGALFMLVLSALMLLSMVPVILPSVMAAHSIVGEKLTRSLEPLLVTPIRTWELLVGKLLAIVGVAIVPSLVAYGIYVVVLVAVAPPEVLALAVSPAFLLTVGVVGPLSSVLAVTFGMMVSARSSDLQTAQGISGLLVLPAIGLGMAQLFGAVAVTVTSAFLKIGILLVVDAGMLVLCVSIFERETILSRWG